MSEDDFNPRNKGTLVITPYHLYSCICFPILVPFNYANDIAKPFILNIFNIALNSICCCQAWSANKAGTYEYYQ